MTNKLKKAITIGSAIATVLAISPASVFAEDVNLSIPGQFSNLSNITPQSVVTFIIGAIFVVAGLFSFIYLLWGGVQWILAGGDKEGTEKARKRITAALIGLAIVFSAYALVLLVQTIFGVSILTLKIPTIY